MVKKTNENASSKKIDKIKDQQTKLKKDRELKELRAKIDKEVDYTLDGSVKQLFLNLTKMQIPFDYEHTLEEFFPSNIKKDTHGNYYTKIGDSKSMFCGHLDTYCYEYKRVWHVIKGNKISTDGTTTLGGDDKAGIVIMLKMIEAGVPGLYYFFRGEEGVTSPSGTWGSKQALKTNKEKFEKYDRCIAFDRRDTNNLITQQMYGECCSEEFAEALINDLGEYNLRYYEDETGMWCDSGVFMDVIPECTNISVGYVDEHTFKETQDIEHLEKLVEACIKIKWEELPTKRDPSLVSYGVGRYNYDYDYEWDGNYSSGYKKRKKKHKGVRDYVTMDDMFWHIVDILESVGYDSLNDDFGEADEMYFQNYKTGDFFGLKIIDFEIFISEDDSLQSYEHVGDLDTFEKYVSLGEDVDNLDDDAKRHLDSISKEAENIELTSSEDFTNNQNYGFKGFTIDNKPLVNDIINDIKSKNAIEIEEPLWIKLDDKITKANLNDEYDGYLQGLNADDYVDWLKYNWEWCFQTVGQEIEEDKKQPTKLDANTIFFDIAMNQESDAIKKFIEQVIDKGHVDKKDKYDTYQIAVNSWIKKKYSKELNQNNNEINHRNFIDWLKEHKKDLKIYYED
jgi:hypothetical protein